MHKAVLFLFVVLALVQTVLSAGNDHGLTNGIYHIYHGNYQVPKTHRFFTAKPDKRDGVVVLAKSIKDKKDKSQQWKVKVHKNGRITVESAAAKGKFISTGREGNNNGAFVRLGSSQQFIVTKKAGGPFTSFELAHPKRTSAGNITVVSRSGSNDPNGNEYVAYINQEEGGSFKFAKLS
ncbi:hypothetical protein BGZ73_001569 [Actinomortierella ambigua]|nr:hypothetical protein BGZ73_001569 [Actinomortierella ambigua]